MKTAIDCRMLGSSGIGTYIAELLPFFLKNSECLLIGRSEDIEQYRDNINAQLCPCSVPVFSLKELFAFPRSIVKQINNCDIYYTPYCNIPSGIRIPVYSTIHDIVFLDIPGLASKAGVLVRKLFYKRAIHKSKVIFTVSKFSAERIKKLLKCRKPVVVTYSAVPSWLLSPSKKATKTDTILFVGNIKKHKGLHVLLPAFLEARKRGLTQQLLIVGNAENFRTGDETIKHEIDFMPEDSVKFTGRISDEELKTLYKEAKLLIQPSLYEGFGLPPLEAMTLGTNALISDIPVFKEIYDQFPVMFFKDGDFMDLALKMMNAVTAPPPDYIPRTYSFENTYKLIFAAIDFYK